MKTIQKNIRFPKKAVNVLEKRGEEIFGFNFQEYVRYLVNKEVEKTLYPDLVKNVIESENDFKKGDYSSLKTKEDIDEYFEKIKQK